MREKRKHDEIVLDKEYYLANDQGGLTVGNSMKWWAIEDEGYTCDLRYAKVFQGLDMKLSKLRECDLPFLKEEVDKLVQHHVDFQDLYTIGPRDNEPHTTKSYKKWVS